MVYTLNLGSSYAEDVSEEKKAEIERLVEAEGVDVLDGEGEMGGWTGGAVVLVDTSTPVDKWEILARRDIT